MGLQYQNDQNITKLTGYALLGPRIDMRYIRTQIDRLVLEPHGIRGHLAPPGLVQWSCNTAYFNFGI